jgi:hypothetical protein
MGKIFSHNKYELNYSSVCFNLQIVETDAKKVKDYEVSVHLSQLLGW